MKEAFEPISLGAKCETKYQIARVLNQRLWPERSEMTFRYAITRRPRDVAFSRWRLFDWLGTPLRAVCDYLERDFAGVFELEDFIPTELGAHNVRFRTNHLHDFIPGNGRKILTPDEIVEQYPKARREFQEHAENFRTLMQQPGPYLYVVVDPEEAETQVPRLVSLLSRQPQHQFHVLLVDHEGANADLPKFGDKVSRTFRKGSSKPDNFAWEGDDESWDELLRDFTLARHPDATDRVGSTADAQSIAGASQWSPAAQKHMVWRGGPASVFCYLIWRELGATLEQEEVGARLHTIPTAWSYSACIKLDLGGIDFDAHRVWARTRFSDVRGDLMLAAYDPVQDRLAEEMLVGQGKGPLVMEIELKSASQTQLMLRTGEAGEAAAATIVDVDIVIA